LLWWWGGRSSPQRLTVGAFIWLAAAVLAGLLWRRLQARPRRPTETPSVLEAWAPPPHPVIPLEGTAPFSQTAEAEHRAWLQSRFRERARQLLGLLKQAIPQARSCAVFLYQPADDRLRLELCVGGAPHDYQDALQIVVGHGAIGWAAKERKPCLYARLDPARQRPDYYRVEAAIRSLLVVPFLRGERLEGVLCVDSVKAESLGEREEGLLTSAAGCLQTQLEDLWQQGETVRQNRHFSMLHAASQSLNSGLDLQRRLEAMTEMAQQIVRSDLCLLCLVEEGERKAQIRVVRGTGVEPHLGRSFPVTDGLVSLVVKNRQPILLSRLPDEPPTRFFPLASKIRLTARSFLGLPLVLQDRVIGLLICMADQPSAFAAPHQRLLSILCNQAAQAIADAQLHAQVERLAAIDGLTGLLNHRAFHERLRYEWERAQRHGEPLALLMIDLDHFKRVNDTYGHQSGDRILKQVAVLLSRLARKVDTVGRYGGEEFAALLPKTTAQQAGKIAERLRKVVERHPFGPDGVVIPVTLSIGVASAPADATGPDHLVSVADKALYRAKEQGRNRTVRYAELVAAMSRTD
jgi:diguanylate cyclase (GGDEF)-like protein